MRWPEFLQGERFATAEDVRKIFADYHDALHWLAGFLIGDELAPACVIDACNIAERQGAVFHEWLAHWAARATLRCALQRQRTYVEACAPQYERFERVHTARAPLTPQNLQLLVERADALRCRLDVLCRYALIMHGIAKEPYEEVAGQLGVSKVAVERAYCVAFDTLHLISEEPRETDAASVASAETTMLA